MKERGRTWFMFFAPCSMTTYPHAPPVVIDHATHWPWLPSGRWGQLLGYV
jgi:hypothetical protein